MKNFKLFVLLFLTIGLFFNGCEKKKIGEPEKIHWDRDVCQRCKMAISERKYAAEIINPKSGKTYKFDDIGCATLWMDEEKIPWKEKAIIWTTDAKTGKWIDARGALYTDDSITPMAYGLAAYTKETVPKNHEIVSFKKAKKIIYEVEKLNTEKLEEMRKESEK